MAALEPSRAMNVLALLSVCLLAYFITPSLFMRNKPPSMLQDVLGTGSSLVDHTEIDVNNAPLLEELEQGDLKQAQDKVFVPMLGDALGNASYAGQDQIIQVSVPKFDDALGNTSYAAQDQTIQDDSTDINGKDDIIPTAHLDIRDNFSLAQDHENATAHPQTTDQATTFAATEAFAHYMHIRDAPLLIPATCVARCICIAVGMPKREWDEFWAMQKSSLVEERKDRIGLATKEERLCADGSCAATGEMCAAWEKAIEEALQADEADGGITREQADVLQAHAHADDGPCKS